MSSIIFNNEGIKLKYKLKKNLRLNNISSIKNPKNNSLIFLLKSEYKNIHKLKAINKSLIIIEDFKILPSNIKKNNFLVKSRNPKMEFMKILKDFELIQSTDKILNPINSKIPKSVKIEPFVFIDHNVEIGKNCVIKSGVKIYQNVKIGNNTTVGPNSVIGYKGFGIDRDKENMHKKIPLHGKPLKMKHYGGVQIGKNVDIGAFNTIASGTISKTVLSDYVVTDDHVHIAHNCNIKKGVAITASAQLSGGVEIGENSWIGPNSSIMQKVKIGKKNIVGLSTVIFRDTENNTTWLGNPARKVFKGK